MHRRQHRRHSACRKIPVCQNLRQILKFKKNLFERLFDAYMIENTCKTEKKIKIIQK